MSIGLAIRKRNVDLALLLVAFLWGASYLAAKTLTQHVPVITVLSIRFTITTFAMLIIWFYKREKIGRDQLFLGLGLGSVQALILFCETAGVARTTATNAGLIISLCIVLTPILESIASRNWLPRSFFVAAVVAVVGVALLVSDKGFSIPNTGDWLMLAAALVRALHVTSMGHLTKGKNYSSVVITLLQSFACGLIFTILSGRRTIDAIKSFRAAQWEGMLFLSLLCGALAFLITLWGIRQTSSSRASLLLGTEPVWAVVVGVAFGGEKLLWLGAVGEVLIIGSTYVGQSIESRHRATQR